MAMTLNCTRWMQNQHDQTPCTTAQEVGQLCNAGYTVSLTNFKEGNYVPNATTANGCTCSWSIYNLLSACSYCVGQYQYTSWTTWIADCGSYTSNTSYLPSGLRISQGIPYWATTNPSTWDNAVFNVTQASNIAEPELPDVTGGPLPTSTSNTTPSSASNVSVGPIVGGVIGAILITIIGGLVICWVVRRRRRQRTHTSLVGVPSFSASQPVTVAAPPTQNQTQVQPPQYGYSYRPVSPRLALPVHSATSLAATSPLTSPVSSGFSSNMHNASLPLADLADMITPFLTMSPMRARNRSNASLPVGKATVALSERGTAPSGQRARLNPPPYSEFVAPESPEETTTGARRMSTKKQKKRNGGQSGATTSSGHSRTSTGESATTVRADPRTTQSRPRVVTLGDRTAKTVGSDVSAGSTGKRDGSRMVATHSGGAGRSDRRPPAV